MCSRLSHLRHGQVCLTTMDTVDSDSRTAVGGNVASVLVIYVRVCCGYLWERVCYPAVLDTTRYGSYTKYEQDCTCDETLCCYIGSAILE